MKPLLTHENIRAISSRREGRFSMPGMELYNDYYGLGLRRTGESVIITLDKTIVVSPGDLVLINRNLYHRAEYFSNDLVTESRVHFKESAVQHFNNHFGNETLEALFEQVVIHLHTDAERKVSAVLYQMEYEYAHFDQHSNFVLENLLHCLFIEVIRGQKTNAAAAISDPLHNDHLLSALQYLELHFNEDPNLETIASAINVSQGHLSRQFTLRLGTSYSDFLLNYKLKHAQRLLTKTKLSITEIAAQSGFGSSNYFGYAFKKTFQVSPLQYRQSYRKS